MLRYFFPVSLLILSIIVSCHPSWRMAALTEEERKIVPIEEYAQPLEGDPKAGFQYMIYGDHVGNGIPWDVYTKFYPVTEDSIFRRDGKNGQLDYVSIAFDLDTGVTVVSGNCYTCHSQRINGKLYLGLGNSFSDYTKSTKPIVKAFNFMVKRKYGKDSRTWELYKEQGEWYEALAPAVKMVNPGLNPAFRLEEACVAHRDPADLTYQEESNFKLQKASIGTDVPPLWNVQKKKALYYNGVGRGDFSKLLMQVTVLGVHDSTKARIVQKNFRDVLAYLNTIEPPKFPGDIDPGLAGEGQLLFGKYCQDCHGSYEEPEFYPNKIIPLNKVGTDSAYAIYNIQTQLFDWFNDSWFAKTTPLAYGAPSYGYMAPPLDAIWATAPYLHNGSVPNLESLLNSSKRPTYWQRSGSSYDYDLEKVGWKYDERKSGRGKWTYNTTLPGSGNGGHTYGDKLSSSQRKAMIEYLKTI